MNVPNDIQVQVDFRGIKRAFVTSEPQSYDELLSLIHSRIKNINISASCLMYENDEGDFVLLAKDANSLAIAVQSSRKIHGVDLKRLKLKVLECTSPTGTTHGSIKTSNTTSADVDNITHSLSFGMKELSPGPGIVSPAEKRGRFDHEMPSSSSTIVSSSTTDRRRKLNFSTHGADKTSSKTPLDRYIENTELSIVNEEESLRSLLEKRDDITERLRLVKSDPSEGNLCSKCHLRLGHTARKCTYGHCQSVFSCGEEKLHAGELNVKELGAAIRKKEARIKELKTELENKKAAYNSLKQNLSMRIEAELMQVNGDEYTYFGHKNWTLLRKHVYAVEQYCKREFNGKIPAKKDLKTVLANALNNCESLAIKPSVVRSNQRRAENPAKPVLQKYGIEFPSPSVQPVQQIIPAADVSSLYYRCKPSSEEEEEAQFQTALIESRALSRNENQTQQPLSLLMNCYSSDPSRKAACKLYKSEVPEFSGNASTTTCTTKISSPKTALKEFLASDESETDSDSTVDDTIDAANTLLSLVRE